MGARSVSCCHQQMFHREGDIGDIQPLGDRCTRVFQGCCLPGLCPVCDLPHIFIRHFSLMRFLPVNLSGCQINHATATPTLLQPPPQCSGRYSWLRYDAIWSKAMNLNNHLNYKSTSIFQENRSSRRASSDKSSLISPLDARSWGEAKGCASYPPPAPAAGGPQHPTNGTWGARLSCR